MVLLLLGLGVLLDVGQEALQLLGAELVGKHRGAAGVLLEGVEHVLLLEDGDELLVGLVVHVRLAGHPHIDVWAGFLGFDVILIDGVFRVEARVGHVIVVDHTGGDGLNGNK